MLAGLTGCASTLSSMQTAEVTRVKQVEVTGGTGYYIPVGPVVSAVDEGIKQAKSTSGADIAASLETVRLDDGAMPAYYRSWDHQMVRRWTVFKVKDHITDKWDWLDQVSVVPKNPADLDKLYGTRQEIGCNMPPRQA